MKEKRATIQIRIEPELKERLERIAEQKALNISALLRKWIEEFVKKWDTVEVEKVIYRLNDYPRIDEAYMIGLLADGRYCFAWGSTFPFADRLPVEPIDDGESGISFHATEEEARAAMEAAKEAVEATRG